MFKYQDIQPPLIYYGYESNIDFLLNLSKDIKPVIYNES